MSTEPLFGLNQPSPPEYQPQFSLWLRQLLSVLLILAVIYLLTLIAPVLPMLTVAFLLAFVMFVPSRAIARNTPIPYALTVILLYMLLIALLIIGMLVIIPTLASAANSLTNTLQDGYIQFTESLSQLNPEDAVVEILGTRVDVSDVVKTMKSLLIPHETSDTGAVAPDAAASGTTDSTAVVEPTATAPPDNTAINDTPATPNQATGGGQITVQQGEVGNLINQFLSVFGSVTQTVTSAIGSITGFVASLLLAIFISFLVLLDIPNTQKALAQRVPTSYHREFALLLNRMVRVWNGFFRGQVLIGVMIGILTWIQLSLMGIGSAVILSVIVGVISLIPTIGSIFALVPLALVPLIQGSTVFPEMPHGVLALFVLGVNLVINQIIWNIVAPKILGDALDLPLPFIIVGVFIGAAAGGVLGAFLVAPIMASLRVVFSYLWAKINLADPYPGEEAPFDWGADPFENTGTNYIARIRLPARLLTGVKPAGGGQPS